MNKLYVLGFISIILFSCSHKGPDVVISDKGNYIHQTSIVDKDDNIGYGEISDNFKNLNQNLKDITSISNINTLEKSIKEDDFVKTQKVINIILKDFENKKEQLGLTQKENIKGLLYLNVSSILNEGNYGFSEKSKSIEGKKFIDNIISKDPDFVDPFYNNYFLGYSQEIIKNYTGALNYYYISLDYAGNIQKNKMLKSVILNQIGHLYDLKGELEKAYGYYYESYANNKKSPETALNIGRYFIRKNNSKEAITYLNYALKLSENPKLKSEILYDLSTLYLYSSQIKNHLELSYKYALESTNLNNKSPLGYLGQARVLVTQWKDIENAESLLKQSITIYPDFSPGYERLGLIEQGKGKYSTSIDYFLKGLDTTKKDIILMDNERSLNSSRINYFLATSLSLGKNQEMCMKHLNEMLILGDKVSLLMFIKEIKKENYGNFKNMTGNKDFEKLAQTILNI